MEAKQRRVLVVDNDPDAAALIANALRRRGFETEPLFSAPECLDWLARRPADAVVAEEQMPYMSGLQLFAGLRQAYPRMPVVLLTRIHASQIESDAQMLGVFEVLRKPVRVDALAATIQRALTQ